MTRDALDSNLNSDLGRLRQFVHLDGEGDGRGGLRECLVPGPVCVCAGRVKELRSRI